MVAKTYCDGDAPLRSSSDTCGQRFSGRRYDELIIQLHSGNTVCNIAALYIGTLTLSLVGYDSIPTDGTGRVLIFDIGRGNDDSLICQSDEATGGRPGRNNWYYHPVNQTIANDQGIQSTDNERGWQRNRGEDFNGFQLVRLRSHPTIRNPLEGVFTCDICNDTESPISVGIYYTGESQDYIQSPSTVHGKHNRLTINCLYASRPYSAQEIYKDIAVTVRVDCTYMSFCVSIVTVNVSIDVDSNVFLCISSDSEHQY